MKTWLPHLLGRYYGHQFRQAIHRHLEKVARVNREYRELLR